MTEKSRLQHRYDRIRENAKRYSRRMTAEDRKRYREMVPPPGPPLIKPVLPHHVDEEKHT